jgi:hypothetical protein
VSQATVYTCDVCGIQRKLANHWCLGVAYTGGASKVQPWDADLARRKATAHFCGVPHALQWAGQRLTNALEAAKKVLE